MFPFCIPMFFFPKYLHSSGKLDSGAVDDEQQQDTIEYVKGSFQF